ncbi:hypothetical protein NE237_023671 [Protea cynaroides]|uniref:Uncharacterized protein n=1 Tax=Protea cynaroides TaxID=273540 RepID=A0A9Q0HGR3_9MAGN|nr:hypothetical protein NE237_023671 [Protea cynaroides]
MKVPPSRKVPPSSEALRRKVPSSSESLHLVRFFVRRSLHLVKLFVGRSLHLVRLFVGRSLHLVRLFVGGCQMIVFCCSLEFRMTFASLVVSIGRFLLMAISKLKSRHAADESLKGEVQQHTLDPSQNRVAVAHSVLGNGSRRIADGLVLCKLSFSSTTTSPDNII